MMNATETLRERLDSMELGSELVVVPPTFEAKMFGANMAKITKAGRITVTFTDGETKSQKATASLLQTISDELTMSELVGAVQA